MKYFPVFLDAKRINALVVGGGEVAARKIELLLKSTKQITVMSASLNASVERLVNVHQLTWLKYNYQVGHMVGMTLVIAATDSESVNSEIAQESASLNLLTGKGSIHFWYIPVLIIMFLATPFLSWLKGKSHIATCLLMLMPLIISRSPFPDFLKPQSFAFFIGAYALGMVIGEHYDKLIQLTNKYLKPLICLVIISTLSIFLLYLNDYKPDGFYSLRQTLIYLQKVSICLLVLHWFYHKESALPQWLSTLGSYAFAIFFLHVIFIDLVISSVRTIASTYRTVEVIALLGSLNLIVAVIGSVLLASIIKKCFGRHSRKVIGV